VKSGRFLLTPGRNLRKVIICADGSFYVVRIFLIRGIEYFFQGISSDLHKGFINFLKIGDTDLACDSKFLAGAVKDFGHGSPLEEGMFSEEVECFYYCSSACGCEFSDLCL